MDNLSKLLDLGSELVDEVCNNPTKENTKKLELITEITRNEIQKISNEIKSHDLPSNNTNNSNTSTCGAFNNQR